MSTKGQTQPALDEAAGSAVALKVRISRCTHEGAWWASHIGRVITVLFTDEYGYWTRDTETSGGTGWDGYRFLQWVKPEDCELFSEKPNGEHEPRGQKGNHA